tara:strand:- start:172 stop:384 length:213 start_codon:yes stop_codon:yes gene_type:complete
MEDANSDGLNLCFWFDDDDDDVISSLEEEEEEEEEEESSTNRLTHRLVLRNNFSDVSFNLDRTCARVTSG